MGRNGIMATSKGFFDFILEELSHFEEITFRRMMGEYIIYYRGKIVGGLYDDRLLVKNVPSAKNMLPDADFVVPYKNAKEMIMVEDVENRDFLINLFNTMYDELPMR